MAEFQTPTPRRSWNVGRAVKTVFKNVVIRLRCRAAIDDAVALAQIAAWRPLFEGKSVALVGNAQSLFGQGLGEEIESAAVVARLNVGHVRSRRDQGARTDVLFFATKMAHSTARRLFGCDRFVWGSPKRSMIAFGFLLNPRSTAFVPLADLDELVRGLGARPSTGLAALYLLLHRLGVAEVRLYGFDWKETNTFYESDIFLNVHNWAAERDMVQAWMRAAPQRLILRATGSRDAATSDGRGTGPRT